MGRGWEGKGARWGCEVAWEGAGRRRGARGSVGARVEGGEGGFGAQKGLIILYYARAPKAREKFWGSKMIA